MNKTFIMINKKIIILTIAVALNSLWSQNPWRNNSTKNEMIEKTPARDMSKPVEWGYIDSLAGVYYLDQVPYSGPVIKQLEIGLLTGEFKAGLKHGLWQTLNKIGQPIICLLYTSPSPRDGLLSRMPSSA